jgi:hypothetical protein
MATSSTIPDMRVDSRRYLSGLADLRHAIDTTDGPASLRVRAALWDAEIAHLQLIVEVQRLRLGIAMEECHGQ